MLVPILFVLSVLPGEEAVDLDLSWCNPLPQGRTIRGLDFLDDSEGVAVGVLGTVLLSSDGGASWSDRSDFTALGQDLHDVLLLASGSILAVGQSPGTPTWTQVWLFDPAAVQSFASTNAVLGTTP